MPTLKPDVSAIWGATGGINDPGGVKIGIGWVDEIPPYQWQNFWQNRVDKFQNHVNEQGMPEWDAATEYPLNGYAKGSDGDIYKSLVAANTGNDPISSPVEWLALPLSNSGIGFSRLWNTNTPPDGYLEEDGSAVSRITYEDLFNVIGTIYGVGDGATTFNLPDSRGEFIRGWDHGAGNDPNAGARTDSGGGVTGDNVGTKQLGQNELHNHDNGTKTDIISEFNEAGPDHISIGFANGVGRDAMLASGGDEARPRNVYKMYVIKY